MVSFRTHGDNDFKQKEAKTNRFKCYIDRQYIVFALRRARAADGRTI